MAVYIYPKAGADQLLDQIMDRLNSAEESPTWEVRRTKIVHTAQSGQWDEGAYLTLAAKKDGNTPCLVFYFKTNPGTKPRSGTFGVYNGRFVQFLMTHFTADITHVMVKDLR